jgi:hypothetical protein
MGMEQTVILPVGGLSCWSEARALLASRGIPIQVRMIDGELAFPDEEPSEDWRELRVGAPGGQMVTIKHAPDRFTFVVWGNADAKLLEFRDALAQAFADAGHGQIQRLDAP